MNKHTPGPWVVYTNPVTGSHVIGQPDGPPIVKLKAGQVSNAHIIAAAPAMYEALQTLVEYLDTQVPAGTLDDWKHVFAAKQALAQAEGTNR